MNKKLMWTIGLGLAALLVCGASIGVGMMLYSFMSGDFDLGSGDAVALIRVEGVIQAGDPPTDFFGDSAAGAYSNSIVAQLKDANSDESVKAIVIRVDSPGGGVVASDEIYQQMTVMDKPVIISMGSMAASGGYYISAPADEIWANRHTLTGSLGVIIQFISAQGLFEEYGIEANAITSGEHKDTGSLYRDMTAEEEAIWQAIVDESYQTFVSIIAEGRSLNEETVRELADGRVYTGQQALNLGLVDNLGNLPDVINRAAELGNIQGEPRIIEYGLESPVFGSLWGAVNQPSPVEEMQKLLHLNTGPQLMYLYTGN